MGGVVNGIVDTIGGLFGAETSAMKNQRRALEQQAKAQEQQMAMQKKQMQQQQAQAQQATNKANKDIADAAAAVEAAPEVTNESNLTGGLGVPADSLELGSPTLLGDDYDDKKNKRI